MCIYLIICEAFLQNPQNIAYNELVVIWDYNLINYINQQALNCDCLTNNSPRGLFLYKYQ